MKKKRYILLFLTIISHDLRAQDQGLSHKPEVRLFALPEAGYSIDKDRNFSSLNFSGFTSGFRLGAELSNDRFGHLMAIRYLYGSLRVKDFTDFALQFNTCQLNYSFLIRANKPRNRGVTWALGPSAGISYQNRKLSSFINSGSGTYAACAHAGVLFEISYKFKNTLTHLSISARTELPLIGLVSRPEFGDFGSLNKKATWETVLDNAKFRIFFPVTSVRQFILVKKEFNEKFCMAVTGYVDYFIFRDDPRSIHLDNLIGLQCLLIL